MVSRIDYIALQHKHCMSVPPGGFGPRQHSGPIHGAIYSIDLR